MSKQRLARVLTLLLILAGVSFGYIQLDEQNPETSQNSETPVSADVERVIDGDTIKLSSGETVRLIGIDTPELSREGRSAEPYAEEAKRHLEDLLRGETIRLEKDVSETDRYGRLLRYVYVGDENLSIRMARDGYAHTATFPSGCPLR